MIWYCILFTLNLGVGTALMTGEAKIEKTIGLIDLSAAGYALYLIVSTI